MGTPCTADTLQAQTEARVPLPACLGLRSAKSPGAYSYSEGAKPSAPRYSPILENAPTQPCGATLKPPNPPSAPGEGTGVRHLCGSTEEGGDGPGQTGGGGGAACRALSAQQEHFSATRPCHEARNRPVSATLTPGPAQRRAWPGAASGRNAE